MSIYKHLLDEAISLLTRKGYDEKSLNSADREGWLFRSLTYKLGEAIQDGIRYGEKEDFFLKTVGWFNDCKDTMLFKLGYEFDIGISSLELKQVEFFDFKTRHVVFLNSNEDLPFSKDSFKLLEQAKKEQQIVQQMRNARFVPVHRSGENRKFGV